jgi:hypothetical protein
MVGVLFFFFRLTTLSMPSRLEADVGGAAAAVVEARGDADHAGRCHVVGAGGLDGARAAHAADDLDRDRRRVAVARGKGRVGRRRRGRGADGGGHGGGGGGGEGGGERREHRGWLLLVGGVVGVVGVVVVRVVVSGAADYVLKRKRELVGAVASLSWVGGGGGGGGKSGGERCC